MIICANCGSTNDSGERFCRKCGALLPVSHRAPRMRMPLTSLEEDNSDQGEPSETIQSSKNEQDNKKSTPHVNPQVQFFSPQPAQIEQQANKELHRIPGSNHQHQQGNKPSEQENEPNIIEEDMDLGEIPMSFNGQREFDKQGALQEISPQPFQGSLISSRGIYGRPRNQSSTNMGSNELTAIPEAQPPAEKQATSNQPSSPNAAPKVKSLPRVQPIPSNSPRQPSTTPRQSNQTNSQPKPEQKKNQEHLEHVKRKRLEDDMQDVLGVLSKKLKIPERETIPTKQIEKGKELKEEKISPASMNDILKMLLTVDTHIEASAIIKMDGTILASAISNRISDSLFATIGQNLSMIGNDIIDGLSAGTLRSISVKGSKGVLDLAPIDRKSSLVKDMILIIFSHPRVKSGIISVAASVIKKEIKKYLGIDK